MKKVKEGLKERGASDEEVTAFEKGAQGFAKKIIANFKDYEFLIGESMDPDGMYVWNLSVLMFAYLTKIQGHTPQLPRGRRHPLRHRLEARSYRDEGVKEACKPGEGVDFIEAGYQIYDPMHERFERASPSLELSLTLVDFTSSSVKHDLHGIEIIALLFSATSANEAQPVGSLLQTNDEDWPH